MARMEPHPPPSPLEGEGWGGGCLFDSAGLIPTSPLAHAKSDVSDLANVNTEIGNCRFRMAREPTSPTRGEVTEQVARPNRPSRYFSVIASEPSQSGGGGAFRSATMRVANSE